MTDKIKITRDNIPADIQKMFDDNVNFSELQDFLFEYRKLEGVKLYASSKGVSPYVDIDWDYFYEMKDVTKEDVEKLLKMDEEYDLDAIVAVWEEIENE